MGEKRHILLWDLKRINLEIESLVNSLMEDMGLTASQGAILIYILQYEEKGICSTQIHKSFGIARATVSSLLKKLRQKGYIEFKSCEQDDRQKIILVTSKGEEVKEMLDLRMQDMEQGLLKGMTKEEEQQMAGCFGKLERNLAIYRGGRIKYESNFRTIKTI